MSGSGQTALALIRVLDVIERDVDHGLRLSSNRTHNIADRTSFSSANPALNIQKPRKR